MVVRGDRIGPYVVEGILGDGAMAIVYRVTHATTGRTFALKRLSVPRPDIRDRLVREGRAQAGLRHPNIVAVHEMLDVEGAAGLVMEYVDGPTLAHWLTRHRPTQEEALSLFVGIARGLAVAHQHGLVHRDLKPANVLLAWTQGGFVPKITDFGIAKVLHDGGPEQTQSNIAMGTPHYMAPEQIRDARTVDARADIFSLGCVLHELLFGERAFLGDDLLTVLNRVAEGDRAAPRALQPTLPEHLVRVLEGCLATDRDARFPSVEAVLSALGTTEVGAVRTGLVDRPADWIDDTLRRVREQFAGGPGDTLSRDRATNSKNGEDTLVRAAPTPTQTLPIPPRTPTPTVDLDPPTDVSRRPESGDTRRIAVIAAAVGAALGVLVLVGVGLSAKACAPTPPGRELPVLAN